MTTHRALRKLSLWTAAAVLLAAAACSSDSPSEPTRNPGPPPGSGGGGTSVTYNVSVTASPTSIPAGSSDPVIVSVRAVRADNGQAPANGTTVVLSALTGSFGSAGAGSSFTGQLTNGRLEVPYYPAADVQGSVVVTANVAGSIGRVTLQIEEAQTFYLSYVEPSVGSTQGGDVVELRGGGFEGPVRVLFGGINAQVLSVAPTVIRVRTPASPSPPEQRATVAVSATINVNQEGEASDSLAGAFTYSPGGEESKQPVLLSVSPTTGPNDGGTRVTINGEGFQAPVQVEFGVGGTFLEAQIVSITSTRLVVITPAATGFGQSLRNQNVTIRVRNVDSGRTGTLASAFRYGSQMIITSLSPTQGPYTGGQLVTIFGQGFSAPVAVEMGGGYAQQIVSVSGTEIVVRTSAILTNSCTDQSGPVEVVNINSGEGATGPGYIYLVSLFKPVIFSVAPTSGTQDGGTLVTITGQNLGNPVVAVGGRPAAVQSVSSNGETIVIRTPFLPIDEFATEACDDDMDGTSGLRYLDTTKDITVTNANTTCSVTFTKAFTYVPKDKTLPQRRRADDERAGVQRRHGQRRRRLLRLPGRPGLLERRRRHRGAAELTPRPPSPGWSVADAGAAVPAPVPRGPHRSPGNLDASGTPSVYWWR